MADDMSSRLVLLRADSVRIHSSDLRFKKMRRKSLYAYMLNVIWFSSRLYFNIVLRQSVHLLIHYSHVHKSWNWGLGLESEGGNLIQVCHTDGRDSNTPSSICCPPRHTSRMQDMNRVVRTTTKCSNMGYRQLTQKLHDLHHSTCPNHNDFKMEGSYFEVWKLMCASRVFNVALTHIIVLVFLGTL